VNPSTLQALGVKLPCFARAPNWPRGTIEPAKSWVEISSYGGALSSAMRGHNNGEESLRFNWTVFHTGAWGAGVDVPNLDAPGGPRLLAALFTWNREPLDRFENSADTWIHDFWRSRVDKSIRRLRQHENRKFRFPGAGDVIFGKPGGPNCFWAFGRAASTKPGALNGLNGYH